MSRRVIALFLVSIIGVGCSAGPAPTPTTAPAVSAPTAGPAGSAPISAPAAPATEPVDVAKTADSSKPTELAKPAEAAKPAAPTVATADPKAALTDAFRGWGNAKSFRAKINTTGLPSGDSESQMEVVMPDRIHMTKTSGSGIDMIIVGGTAWMKLPTGWQKLGTGFDTDLANPKKFEESIGASSESKLIGPDIFEGTPCLVYQYTTTLGPDSGATGGAPAGTAAKPAAVGPSVYTAKVWVGIADQLPRKLESADPSSPARTTIVYYDFNAPISISPPV